MTRIPTDQLPLDMEKFAQLLHDASYAQPHLSLGIKTTWKNYAGIVEPLLFYHHTNWITGQTLPSENGLTLRLEALQAIGENPDFDPLDLRNALKSCTISSPTGWAYQDVFWHAALPGEYTCFIQPKALLALSLLNDGHILLKETFSSEFEILSASDFYSQHQKSMIKLHSTQKVGFIIENLGLLISSSSSENCFSALEQFLTQLKSILTIHSEDVNDKNENELSKNWHNLPELRQAISNQLKYPVILQTDDDHNLLNLTKSEQAKPLLKNDWLLPTLTSRANIQLTEFSVSESHPLAAENSLKEDFTTPGMVLDPEFGSLSIGTNMSEVGYTKNVFHTLANVILTAQKHGELVASPRHQAEDRPKPFCFTESTPLPFTGEISLVTGAASGIGKACAHSLLSRGAVVIGLDINPDTESAFEDENYLGIVCDISDENKVKESMNRVCRSFGGLDMLILNAGLFPKGCNINNMRLDEFNKVININLTSNLVLMREAFPLLKHAPRYGRVVIVGSKNVKAPGPGAVAYSTSKAGLVQMARVAAMEWASEGIRVNVIHPDAVFDTALYTEDVLRARAEFYNMTIEEYKKRNLLKTEITSHIIAEMVAEMCGELFKATTGSQIQVDGGNDRTI